MKPPYNVPSMKEIRRVKPNGLNVISTFSGCGGSSLGYRMAGFNVKAACEFWPYAVNVYKMNSDCNVIMDDIRNVSADMLLDAAKLKRGEVNIFDGSPPCQTFSLAGKRQMADERTDLFQEYIRLLKGISPQVFVAENVGGMVRGIAKGMFKRIFRQLKECGYIVEARLLDAQWLGVPQQRQRIIFIGVRKDLNKKPVFPKPLPYRYTVAEVCPDIYEFQKANGFISAKWVSNKEVYPTIGVSPSSGSGRATKVKVVCKQGGYSTIDTTNRSCPCISATQTRITVETETEIRKLTIDEVKRLMSFPDDFQLNGSYAKQWKTLGNSVPPLMMKQIAETIYTNILRDYHGTT